MASKQPSRRAGHHSRRGAAKPTRRYRPALEPVEPRLLLTAFAYFVDALTDTGAGTGFSGDLRYAITQANLNPGSTITIDTSGTVDLTSALPAIAVDTSIGNPDPGDFLLQGGGTGSNYRALTIDSDVSAIISGIDFTNFATTGNGGILMVDGSLGLVASDLSLSTASSGGAVYISTQGSLTANGCSFHDNSSLNSGGAIDCDNDLNLIGGSLLNNSAGGSGGAVSVDGLMNAYGVEIAGNVASNLGGGIEASDGMGPSGLTITNSTIAENAAENVGGGVMCFISPTLTNDTIAGNSSAVSQGGAGLYIYAGVQPLLKNTLIAQNLSNDIESDIDGMGPTASIDSTSSFNLIGNKSVSGITDSTQGNQIGSSISPLDAELGPLTNNGGTNETIAPNAGSPAIAAGLIADAVDPTTSDPIPFDQRGVGFPRVFNSTIDIGAFQTQAPATSLSVQAVSGTYGGTKTLTATLTSGGDPIVGELVDIILGSSDLGTMTTDVNGVATFSNISLGAFNVGSYTGAISASFDGDSNFAASSDSANLTVTPAPLTITVGSQTQVYGAALPTLSAASYIGLVNDDTPASLTTAPTLTPVTTTGLHVSGSPYVLNASGAVDSNYTISYVAGTLAVTAAPLTITVGSQTQVYGAALPTLSAASYTGLVNGDTPASLTTAPTLTPVTTTGLHVSGSPYVLNASAAVDPDYTISYVAGTLAVTAAPLTITVGSQTQVYGAALPTLSAASYTGLVNGDTPASLTTAPTLTPVTITGLHVTGSPYVLNASAAVDPDYTISYVAGTLAVTAAPLTISVGSQTQVYGAALPTLSAASYIGLVNGDTPASLTTAPTLTPVTETGLHVTGSPYVLNASAAVDPDYTISYVAGTLAVTAAPLTISVGSQTQVYGAALPTLSAGSYTGFVSGDTPASLTTLPTLTPVTENGLHVSGSPYVLNASGAVDPDYTISYVAGTLAVTAAPLTISVGSQTQVYGAALPTLSAASYTGLVNGDTPASLTTAPTLTPVTETGLNVSGSPYVLNASAAVDPDYTISYVAGSLSVTQAPLTVVINNLSKVYGQANPTLTGTVTGVLNGDDVTANYTTTAGQFSDVNGEGYAITLLDLTGAKALDYSTTVEGGSETNGVLAISQAPLTVVIDSLSKVYGQANPTLTGTVTGVLNGDDVTANYTTSAEPFSDVQDGGYAITLAGLSGTKAGDYSTTVEGGSETDGVLTVTPAPLTVFVADQAKVYGQANPAPTGVFTGALNGDDVSVIYSTNASQFSDVQAEGYLIAPTGLSGSKAADYSFSVEGSSVTNGTLTIVPAPLAIVINNLSKVYGQANPTLTGTVAGVLNGDDVTAGYSTTATTSSDVVTGGSPITFTGLTGTKAGDYTVTTSTPGTLTVTPAPLTITAADQTKVYGQANPAFTASYSGFVLGQEPSVLSGTLGFSTPATAASHVGGYAITPNGLTATDYAIEDIAGTLAVTPASLTITAVNIINAYGQPIPTLTAAYSGFVNGDTAASLTTPVSLATSATVASHVNVYPITASGATSGDYTISFTDGAIAIIPANLYVTPVNVINAYGLAIPTLTATYSGFVNGDSPASLSSPVTLSTPAVAGSPVGVYPITASGGASGDYTITYAPGAVAITANPGGVAFVTSLYQSILGRDPETFGLDFWLTALADGTSESDVASQIYNSPEGNRARANHTVPFITENAAYRRALVAQAQALLA